MSETKLVPKLRFEGFNDEWKQYSIKELFDFYPTNSFSRAKLNYENGNIRNIHYGDIHTVFSSILDFNNETLPFINSDENLNKIKKESFLLNGDLIIADASEDYDDIGKATEIINIPENEKIVAGLHTILARNKNMLLVQRFKGYLFLNEKLRLKIKVIANGISVLGISKNNLGNLTVNIPSIHEQSKIASFLSAVDKKIMLLKDKHEQMKLFKKGLMQQIFSQKLRFVEFTCVFNEYVLKDISSMKYGKMPNKTKITEDDTKYPIFSGFRILGFYEEYNIKQNELLITARGSGSGYAKLAPEDCYLTNLSISVNLNKHIVIPSYLYYYFQIYNLRYLDSGSAQPQITINDLSSVKVYLPSINEQQKISDFLFYIDKKLELLNDKISQMEQFKKGLLQQMFV